MIKRVSEENIKDAARVYMNSWKKSHMNICSEEFIEKHTLEYMVDFISKKIKNGNLIFISYDNDIPEGIVSLNPEDDEISLLYVSPEKHGKGVGSKLLDFALSKCDSPYITVLDTNRKAVEFYKKRGFVPAEIQPENAGKKRIFERKYVYQK